LYLVLFQTTPKTFINFVIYIINYFKLSKMLNDKDSKWCKNEKLSLSIFSRLKIVSFVSPKFIKIYVGRLKEYKKQILLLSNVYIHHRLRVKVL
jgi:hypothetical protein